MDTIADFDPNTNTFYTDPYKPTIIFQNLYELILFLATKTKTNQYNDPSRWDFPYYNDQNLTGTDTTVYRESVYTGSDMRERKTTVLKRFWFHDAHNRTIDIRRFHDQIVKMVYQNIKKPYTYKRPIKNRTRTTSHTTAKIRNNVHKKRTLTHAYKIIDEYNEQTYVIPIKPKDKRLQFYWSDDFIMQKSTGWKTKKYKYQWEHNQAAKDTHAANYKKKHIYDTKGCESSQP